MRITADIIDDEAFVSAIELADSTSNPSQQSRVHEMTERLRNLHLSDMFLSPSTYHTNVSHLRGATGSNKQTLSEPMDHPKIEESPPLWLQQWMMKMKSEIKKEILEEILNIPSEFRQIHVPDTQTSKVSKEENPLQYQGEVVHSGIYCDNCDQLIHGIRYKCGNCSDFDLCQECESLPNVHNKNHIFLKIRYPFALKLYQKQKWQELMSPLPIKPTRFAEGAYSKSQSKKLYEAKFLCDETVPDSTVIPPSTRFVKSWKVMNSGTRVWTHATKLHLIQGSAELVPISQKVDVPHLKPGEEGIVSVLFTSPSTPGVYRSHWNFCHKSRPFGHIVWCHIIVKEQSEMKELSDKIVNKQVEVSNIAQVLTAVKEDCSADNIVPRKLIVNSHTATPNNTPFALTPPKSPDHESLLKKVHEITPDKAYITVQNDSDEDDVVSISSESDTEFVVIPMPKCFNLPESILCQQLRLPRDLNESSNTSVSSLEEAKEVSGMIKLAPRKSTPVSQETGVPELSENSYEPLFTVVEDFLSKQKSPQTFHTANGGCSSSEVSIIESESSSPTVENATQTFDSINMTLSTNLSSSSDLERIEVHLNTSSNSVEASSEEITNTGSQEQTHDIPCNVTFPKFPVEGVTSEIYERPSSNNISTEERTIQVLPEGLVIGALSAAASVYNTAKAVISTIQQPKPDDEMLADARRESEQPVRRETDNRPNSSSSSESESRSVDQLVEMGFCNRQQNEILLKKHKGDVALVVAELISLNDNDWYASRHSPASPPGFLD